MVGAQPQIEEVILLLRGKCYSNMKTTDLCRHISPLIPSAYFEFYLLKISVISEYLRHFKAVVNEGVHLYMNGHLWLTYFFLIYSNKITENNINMLLVFLSTKKLSYMI